MAVRYPIVLVGTSLQELPNGDSIAGSIQTAETAEVANNLSNGSTGSIPYQLTSNTTSFLTIGSAGYILTSTGSSPQWSALSSLSAGSAISSNNITGGSAGGIPYQTNVSTTAFLNIGPNNSILVSNGTSPQWVAQSSLTVASATTATTATTATNATNSVSSNNITGGSTGSIPYQTSPGSTSFLNIGDNGYILTSNGTNPVWSSISGLSAGSSLLSTNLANGAIGSIPYQTSPNNTGFLNIGANNSVLVSNGTNPQWVAQNTLSVASATNANALLVGSDYRTASVDSPNIGTPNTIACRDSSGNLNAVKFQGESTSSQAADLAEKYLPDQQYDVGTVVTVGGEKEVTACKIGDRALGAVSKNPAYMMNSNLENGIYIALKGRVFIKIEGKVNKGDKLVAGNNGTAIVDNLNSFNFFAISLESSNNLGLKLIECIIL